MGKSGTCTVTVTPSASAVGDTVSITASGITTADYLNIVVIESDGNTSAVPVGSAMDGSVICAHLNTTAGTTTVEVRDVAHPSSPKVLGAASYLVS